MGLLAPGEAQEHPQEHLQVDIPKPAAPKLRPDEGEFAPEVQAKPSVASGEPRRSTEETQKFIAQSLTDVVCLPLRPHAESNGFAGGYPAPRTAPHTELEKLLDSSLARAMTGPLPNLPPQLQQTHSETGDKAQSAIRGMRRRFQRAAVRTRNWRVPFLCTPASDRGWRTGSGIFDTEITASPLR